MIKALSQQEVGWAMLAMLNRRVGVRGQKEAYRVLADALSGDAEGNRVTPEEAAELFDFEYAGLHFRKLYRKMPRSNVWWDWHWEIVKQGEED